MNEIAKDHELGTKKKKKIKRNLQQLFLFRVQNGSLHRKTSGFVEIILLKSHSVVELSRKNKTALRTGPLVLRATVE